MTPSEVAIGLKNAMKGRVYTGALSSYVVNSIENSLSNYSVKNLITYCSDMQIRLYIKDLITLDLFQVTSLESIHKALLKLMGRYNITFRDIFERSGKKYYIPMQAGVKEDTKSLQVSLSINTLSVICNALHCDLLIEAN